MKCLNCKTELSDSDINLEKARYRLNGLSTDLIEYDFILCCYCDKARTIANNYTNNMEAEYNA